MINNCVSYKFHERKFISKNFNTIVVDLESNCGYQDTLKSLQLYLKEHRELTGEETGHRACIYSKTIFYRIYTDI